MNSLLSFQVSHGHYKTLLECIWCDGPLIPEIIIMIAYISIITVYSIEWLRIQRSMVDPFIVLTQQWPICTTLTPKRDIDFILTFGIDIQSISTLGPDCSACSDHIGIPFDIDPEIFFLHLFLSSSRGLLKLLIRKWIICQQLHQICISPSFRT